MFTARNLLLVSLVLGLVGGLVISGPAGAAVVHLTERSDRGGALGLMSGGDLYKPGVNTNPSALIGSNSADSNTWGSGSTSGATGPDIVTNGSTWRGAAVVRASSVIDADPLDAFQTLGDLNTLAGDLTLTLHVNGFGSATSADYSPMAYYHGVIANTNPTAGYWAAWQNATTGANLGNTVAGVYVDTDSSGTVTAGDRYKYTFSGFAGATNLPDFISFAALGSDDAVANESLTLKRAALHVAGPGPEGTLAIVDNASDNGGAMGFMAGGDKWKPGVGTSPNARIGSNVNDNNTWGTGGTSGASGPDIGSTWRGALAFRATTVLDANPNDLFEIVADLNQPLSRVTLSLLVDSVGPANSDDYAPLAYLGPVVTSTNPTSGYWGAWNDATVGANGSNTIAGVLDDLDFSGDVSAGDLYTFTFLEGLPTVTNPYDFITFGVIGNEDAVANEYLYFSHAGLGVAVPEPSTLLLFALGLLGLGLAGWRRHNRAA